jgi:hypothetical protein
MERIAGLGKLGKLGKICRVRQLGKVCLFAIAPRQKHVIQILLFLTSTLNFISSEFTFPHVAEHFAILPRQLVLLQLLLALIAQIHEVHLELFPVLSQNLLRLRHHVQIQSRARLIKLALQSDGSLALPAFNLFEDLSGFRDLLLDLLKS